MCYYYTLMLLPILLIWSIIKDTVHTWCYSKIYPKCKRKTAIWCNGQIKYQINCLRTSWRKRHQLATKFNLQWLHHLQRVEGKLQKEITNAPVIYEIMRINLWMTMKPQTITTVSTAILINQSHSRTFCISSQNLQVTIFLKLTYSINLSLPRLLLRTQNLLLTPHLLADHNFLSKIVVYKEDVYTALSNFDPAKATRCDGIGLENIITCADHLLLRAYSTAIYIPMD